MTGPRGEYLEQIRRGGVALSPELAAAFASVPREAFVPDGFRRRDGSRVRPVDPEFLPAVYSDDVLVTKMDGRTPTSSSSQPSLMAVMIEALEVAPGVRILEVGAGTGYNAALLASLGASVTSIDVQEDVAVRARTALARAGIAGVRVECADGYLGLPGERFDRVIVTVGITGVSPHWLEQLSAGGFVLAPVVHAGTHPVLKVVGGPPVTGRPICAAGFMQASGPLNADFPEAFPAPASALAELASYAPPRFDPPLPERQYRDLWYAAGAWNRRASHAAVPGRQQSCLALLDRTGSAGAVIPPDGSIWAGGDEADAYASLAARVLDDWVEAGRPPIQAWRVTLARAGPIWVPSSYQVPDRRSRHGRPSGS
jgi:protein-L-isoaspartate(D-aspartate) O-methyltransferase